MYIKRTKILLTSFTKLKNSPYLYLGNLRQDYEISTSNLVNNFENLLLPELSRIQRPG